MPKTGTAPKAARPGGRPAFFRGKEARSKAILFRPADREKLEAMRDHSGYSLNDVVAAAVIRLWETTGRGRLNLDRDFAGK